MTAFEIKPGLSHAIEIDDTLKALQDHVGGYIETVQIADEFTMIIDEDCKLKGLDENILATKIFRYYVHTADFIVGSALIVGTHEDEFVSLTEKQVGELLGISTGKGIT